LLAHNAAAAQQLPGVLRVLHSGNLLGVVATTSAQADAASAALWATAVWHAPADAAEEGADLQQLPSTPRTVAALGPDPTAPTTPQRTLRARYSKPWIAHASIGPSCALALWAGGRLLVHSHSQGIFNLRRDLALAFGVPEQTVCVQHHHGAGCYGHNGADDVAFDAAWLAHALPGQRVRVLWSRADELSHAPFGPAMVMQLQATLDAQGHVASWQHSLYSPGHSRRPGRDATPALLGAWQVAGAPAPTPSIDMPLAVGGGAERNAVPGYNFAALRVTCHSVRTQRRSSALRSLGAFGNVFAIESFIDEIAHATQQCPLALRLHHLQHDPRALAVLQAVVARAGYAPQHQQSDMGMGMGLALARYKGTGAWCAVVAQVQAGAQLVVQKLTIAADIGQVINPCGAAHQIEGGAVQATSWALKEAALPAHSGWADYPILRFTEVPAVDVLLMPSDQPSLGAGEASLGPTAGAIANALFDALGVRMRDLPLTPDRIGAAIHAMDA
jgi:nicotinate dehydrogenase subunit B